MAERINGKTPFIRRTHGSERRGVFPVPSLGYATKQEQSKRDKALILDKIKQRQESLVATPERSDLGNKELPAYKHKQEILTNVEAYKAVILGGPTGSGKSTQLPQYLYEAGYDMTVILVPRRVIADGLGDRIRDEMTGQIDDFEAEETVGIIHGERSERHENNKILVMTPNTFIKMEKDFRDQLGDKKVAIISDEIHESNLFTEIATGVAATAVRDLDNWRLIAASATHNASTLQSSFKELNGEGYVPSIEIEGRPFNVEMQEEPEYTSMEVYAQRGAEHQKSMIFTSGKREIDHIIEETIAELERNEIGSSNKVIFRKLHGELSQFEMGHINDPIPEEHRLVLVSSPAGMSGITIPGVTLVLTDGTINRQELDDDGIPGLSRRYLSKAEITQEIGRAGRDVDGGIGIITKPTTVADDILRNKGKVVEIPQMEYIPFRDREEHAPPEIYSSNLARVVLSVAAIDRRFSDINPYIPHSVKASAIIAAEESLSRLGALDEEDKITAIGHAMDRYPISPELSRGLYEVSKGNRTLQQLARAAFVAAAVDAGGLQDFSDAQVTEWKQLIRPTTADDFIAQLDIMSALEAHGRTDKPLHEFIEAYTLSPKRVERAQKLARKILQKFNINSDNMIITSPLPDEETQLRTDFTSGMIDLVYQETGTKQFRKAEYRNIHGNEEATKRLISGRSVSVPEKGQLVAGIPRWYTKRTKKGEEIRHDVVELTLHVDKEIVGAHAQENGLLQGKLLSPRMENDRVVELEQMMFGTIPVGNPVTTVWRDYAPESSQRVLVESSLQTPGEAQRALREIADELEWYRQHIPADVLQEYRVQNAPAEITKSFIAKLIKEQAQFTRSLSGIDHRLGQYVYSKNVTINRYYDTSAREELQQRSPDVISIANGDVRVLYENGQPYITQISKEQRVVIKDPIYLSDGREILHQVAIQGGGTERISFGN